MKRDQKRKKLRLANEARRHRAAAKRKKLRADAAMVAVRTKDGIAICARRGRFGHANQIFLTVADANLVGCVEDLSELAKLVNNVGLLTIAQLFSFDLSTSLDGLAKHLVDWAGIDLEALRKAAEDEAKVTKTADGLTPTEPASEGADPLPVPDPAAGLESVMAEQAAGALSLGTAGA